MNKNWSAHVTKYSNAMDLEPGVFTFNDPKRVANSLKEQAEEVGFSFPYLYDETQSVAKSFSAVCTPDLFLFDKESKLVYRGQLDDSRPDSDISVSGKDLRAALDNLLSGQPISENQKPSLGCGIKWKE